MHVQPVTLKLSIRSPFPPPSSPITHLGKHNPALWDTFRWKRWNQQNADSWDLRRITGSSAHLRGSPGRCPDEVATLSSSDLSSAARACRRHAAPGGGARSDQAEFGWIFKVSVVCRPGRTGGFTSQVRLTMCARARVYVGVVGSDLFMIPIKVYDASNNLFYWCSYDLLWLRDPMAHESC